jgi:hypothetical protein
VAVDYAFDDEECGLLADGLEKAWEIFLKTGGLTAKNVDIARAALAYAVLECAAAGERNPRRLAIAAVAKMPRHEHQIRYARSFSQQLAS